MEEGGREEGRDWWLGVRCLLQRTSTIEMESRPPSLPFPPSLPSFPLVLPYQINSAIPIKSTRSKNLNISSYGRGGREGGREGGYERGLLQNEEVDWREGIEERGRGREGRKEDVPTCSQRCG